MSLRLFIFSIILFLFECPYQHGNVDWLALSKCFILLKTNIAKQGGTKLNYKVHISGKQGLNLVQLNHGLIFNFFQVCWEHSSQASYFRNNEPVTVRLPIKGKPTTTSLLSASCLLTFSDNSEACFFC